MADVQRLQDFNSAMQNGATSSRAFKTIMLDASESAKTMAVRVARGTVSVEQLTASSKAAAVGMNMLNMAVNMASAWLISSVISSLVKWFQELSESEKRAAEQASNLAQKNRELAENSEQEYKELDKLIEKYKELAIAENYTSVDGRNKLLELQSQITELVGQQANNIDLVNGKLDEEIVKLNEISDTVLNDSIRNSRNAYTASVKEYETEQKQKPKSGSKNPVLDYQWLGFDYTFYTSTNKFTDNSGNELSLFKQLEIVTQLLDAVDQLNDESIRNTPYYIQLLNLQEKLQPFAKAQTDAISQYIEAQTIKQTKSYVNNIDGFEDYLQKRSELIDSLQSDSTIQDAVQNGAISTSDVSQYIDASLGTVDKLSEYYAQWLDYNDFISKINGPFDPEKSLSAWENWRKMQEEILASTFSYSDYKDQIDEVTKSISTLSSAYDKLDAGTATTSDLMSLFDEFPDLAQYADDTDNLKTKVQELAQSNVNPLITQLTTLSKSVKDPTQIKQLENWIDLLQKLSDFSKEVEPIKITAGDYYKYEENNIQKIIDKLEKQKDAQNEILDNLKAQKQELEDIISEYKQIVDIVGDYIDSSQIEPLEDRKSEIEEYYNAQIDKLKEENEERDRNIELQEKQDALANARKTKIRRYDETQGWVYETDVSSIQKAEKELSDLQNEIAIDDLEKQRDSEIKNIEEQIKAWEDYKDEWKKQVDQIVEADNELIASKILGADWHEKIADQDIDVMQNFGSQYVSYNNRLKNQVNVELTNMERAIKGRENEINQWKAYKNQLADINAAITEANNDYLSDLNQFVIDENATWEERIARMRKNATILAQLNEGVNNPEMLNEALVGTGIITLEYNGQTVGWYENQSEAEMAREKMITDMITDRANQPAPPPLSILDQMRENLKTAIKIKKYARGGINTTTGLSWLDGTNSSAEVIFNSSQAKDLYNLVRNGEFGTAMSENILTNLGQTLSALIGKRDATSRVNQINISFPYANINAKDYETFKGFMDRYSNELMLRMQVGL